MDYEILVVGTELTTGGARDKNVHYIIENLLKVGLMCKEITIVPDEIESIAESILASLKHTDILLITGGLGPTFDDVTREAISKATNKKLVFSPETAEKIRNKFKEIHKIKTDKPMPETILRQAYCPEGATLIPSSLGTAPGIILEFDKKLIVALPGVPVEMHKMLKENILPFISRKYPAKEIILARTIKICGVGEIFVEKNVEDLIKKYSGATITILAHPEEVHLKFLIKSSDFKEAQNYLSEIESNFVERLGDAVYGFDGDTLESVAGKLLKEANLTLSTAESCTGGLLAHRITNIPGSSEYFLGGIVAYRNDIKQSILGVEETLTRQFGAVSAEVAKAMAERVKIITNSDIGIGVTGIAGPTGATKEKPVGLVYIALSSNSKVEVEKFNFAGERETVKFKATQRALILIIKMLKERKHA